MKISGSSNFSLELRDVERVRLSLKSDRYTDEQVKKLKMLWLFHKGFTQAEVSNRVNVTLKKAMQVRERYLTLGLDATIMRKNSRGQYDRLIHEVDNLILHLVQTRPPSWLKRWDIKGIQHVLTASGTIDYVSKYLIKEVLRHHCSSLKVTKLESERRQRKEDYRVALFAYKVYSVVDLPNLQQNS